MSTCSALVRTGLTECVFSGKLSPEELAAFVQPLAMMTVTMQAQMDRSQALFASSENVAMPSEAELETRAGEHSKGMAAQFMEIADANHVSLFLVGCVWGYD